MKLLPALFVSLCSLGPVPVLAAGAPTVTPQEKTAEQAITADLLRAHVRFLASDLLEGRGPGTRGDALAQEYIATQFEGLGLKPGAEDGGYLQRFDLMGIHSRPGAMTFQAKAGRVELQPREDFIAVSGVQAPEAKLDASELVFVGYGIVAPEYQWDDFKGADLKGKTLVILNNDPEDDPRLFGGKARLWYGRWDYKYEQAAKTGAAGAIIIHTTPSAGYPWQVVRTSWTGEQFELPAGDAPRLQVKAWTTEDATKQVMKLAGQDLDALRAAAQKRDFHPVPLGMKVSLGLTNEVRRRPTANVLGLLPGSDPTLAKEVVLYSAHHDHLGKKDDGKPGEDVIYNGALDNAAGVASMLSVARAFTALPTPPRRSILFAAVAAEEYGLLGSAYLAAHPPVPPGRIAANINVDGGNVLGRTRDITVIGLGKSSLDTYVTAMAKTQGRTVKADQLSDRGFFYRSDQFNFARQGIPAAYFGSGMDFIGRPEGWGKQQRAQWEAKHYHQPSDEVRPEWDLSGAVEDTRLFFLVGAQVAKALAMPVWNKGDEFEAARLKSLEALKAPAAK
ncbi:MULTISPECIES: M28 family metallopeptidase [unclassified Corallococcus]|uniref:M28 family metallopeptidase n=1 Tax=unclassified Corallococcus TaxID=2685029 RepID=UPI001A8D68EB|nr:MULTISPECIES: M28 family metallopeptidase [unclassified Corallococcus]MBN9683976.1 M28 family peptidase [Corallococcus sp. NCSPR001]WAS84526.1 M28 family metallopeptidase [Corallococcus sp. NCRR]